MRISEVCSEKRTAEITQARTIGIDIGSRSAKGVLISDGEIYTSIIPTGFFMQKTADTLINDLLEQSSLKISDIDYAVGTGYGRIAMHLKDTLMKIVTEISCHGLGAHFLGDDVETIIDIGGQDSKAIRIDPKDGKVVDFVMNDKCAAGTGRFLEKIAGVLGYDVKDIGKVSLEAKSPTQMSTLCVVFAESEVISERAKGENVADISMGVNISVAKRIKNLLSRVGTNGNLLFTGGVSNNIGMKRALETTIGKEIQTARLNTVFAGAFGAALFGQQFAEKSRNGELSEGQSFSPDLTDFDNAFEKRKEELIRKATGKKKNVGYLCCYTPVEILSAADAAHFRLLHAGNSEEVSAGERMTQSVFCDFTKSVLGSFAEEDPLSQSLDHVFTFYTCDCIKKTAEAINTRFVTTSTFNLPRVRDSKNSLEYFTSELRGFAKELETLTGKSISEDEIRKYIALYNRAKQLYRDVSGYRKEDIPLIKSEDFQKLALGYFYLPVEELIEQLEKIKSQLEAEKQRRSSAQENTDTERPLRLMLAGGIIAEGDGRIIDIIENQLGARVVVEDNCTGFKPFIEDIPDTGNVYEDIAKGYLGKAPCARMQKIEDNTDLAAKLAEEYRVDGVVYYYLNFCPCYGLAKNNFLNKFREIDIPVLELTGDYSHNDEGQLRTRIEAFVEVLKERNRV